MKKYYTLSPKQLEDWNYNYGLRDNYPPNIMDLGVEIDSLDISVFEKAYSQLVRDNESLRTSFPKIDGKILQRVEEYSESFQLEYINEVLDMDLNDFIAEKIMMLKDLQSTPLIKGFVVSRLNGGFFIYIIVHHIVSDFWSVKIIREQLFENYQKISADLPILHATERVQLGDFLRRSKAVLPEHHKQIIETWKGELANCNWQVDYDLINRNLSLLFTEITLTPPKHNWKNYDSSTLIANPTGETLITFLNEKLSLQVKQFCTKHAKGTNSIMLAGLFVLGTLVTSLDNLLIQTHYMNRDDPQAHSVIGNLIGKLLLMMKVNKNLSSLEFIEECNLVFYGAISKVIFNSNGIKDFNTTIRNLIFYNFISKEMSGNQKIKFETPKFKTGVWVESPLVFQGLEYGNTIEIKWSFHLDFFDRDAITCISGLFEKIIGELVNSKESSVNQIINELKSSSFTMPEIGDSQVKL